MKQLPKHLFVAAIATPDGEFVATYSRQGLYRLEFPGTSESRPARARADLPAPVTTWHERTTRSVRSALTAQPVPTLPPLDLSAGTDFQRRVWAALQRIECGHTRSYAEVAEAIGQPKAVRAVGAACGANPIPLLIPCHRVVAAHRKLGGFSGGLHWKRLLLSREQSWPDG